MSVLWMMCWNATHWHGTSSNQEQRKVCSVHVMGRSGVIELGGTHPKTRLQLKWGFDYKIIDPVQLGPTTCVIYHPPQRYLMCHCKKHDTTRRQCPIMGETDKWPGDRHTLASDSGWELPVEVWSRSDLIELPRVTIKPTQNDIEAQVNCLVGDGSIGII